jgi:hypothetical protein
VGARDETAGEPVTNFKRSTKLYRTAIGYTQASTATRPASSAKSSKAPGG